MNKMLSGLFKGMVAALMLMVATAQIAKAEQLTMSSWIPATHFFHTDFLVPLTEQIAKATEGRVNVTILPSPLGPPWQHWKLAHEGAADMTWGVFTYEPKRFISMWFAEFPNGGINAQAQSRALWRTFRKHLADNAAFDGVEVLAVGLFGGGQLHHRKKTIMSPEDMQGQKFRTGGPVQELLLKAFGAVPIEAPATRARELLENGVIEGSLHTMESILNLGLDESLTHHTIFPDGLYSASFFVVMNDATWTKLGEADRAAISDIAGEGLSAALGEVFDIRNAMAFAELGAAGHDIVEASPDLVAQTRDIHDRMVADWIVAARDAGVEDPAGMFAFYRKTYTSLAGE